MSSDDNYILDFIEKGVFPMETVLYFDPPLVDYEMYELKRILDSKNIKDSRLVINPIEQAHFYTRYPQGNQLAWITIKNNEVTGWQNAINDSDVGELNHKDAYISWYVNHGSEVFNSFYKLIDGRKLLTQIDTFDLFDQLNENKLNEIGGKRVKDTHIIYRDNNMVILVPLSFDSAKSFSRNTQYCTGGNCSRGSEQTSKGMFKQHTSKGDILYRIFFKDGTKVRLTWNGDINDKNFHWGLGKKDSYPTFSNRNMSNPFDLEQIKEVRLEQLELEFESEPRVKEFEEWEKKFASQWGWDSHDISDVFKKIRDKWGMPNWSDQYDPAKKDRPEMTPEAWEKMHDEETKVYDIYLKKKKEMLGKYYGKTMWWNDGHEALYKTISKIPEDAITKMVEYSMSGDYKPVNESEGDEFDWVNELQPKNIDDTQLRNMTGGYILRPLRLEDLRPGLFIKRRNGKFLYELGEELPLSFTDSNTGEKLNGEMGYMLVNISNGKRYMGRKHQIVRDFYLIQQR